MTTLAGVLAAFYTSTVYVAIPQNKELQMIRQQLAAQMRPNTSQIYFLQPSCDQTAAPRIFSDFGQSSSCHLWVPSNAIYLVLDEMNPAQANIPVKQVPAGETMTPPPDAVIIDMRYLKGELIPTKQELQSQ